MTKTGEDVEDIERVAALADRQRVAWQETIDEAHALADERAAAGWETLVLPTLDTATEPPDVGPDGRYGLVHVVPDNYVDQLTALSSDSFDAYDVYRAENDGRVFLVTELLASDHKLAVFVVANYELRYADGLISAAFEDGRMYTHFERLDDTHLLSIEHEQPAKFFPDSAQP